MRALITEMKHKGARTGLIRPGKFTFMTFV